MKKITLLACVLLGITSYAQVVIFEDGFETYDDFITSDIGDWTLIDGDQLASTYSIQDHTFPNQAYEGSYIIFNASGTTPSLADAAPWSARTGDKTINAFAAIPNAGAGNNDRLISPQITLGQTGNELRFWAKAPTLAFGPETFDVEVSTTGTAVSDFTAVQTNLAPAAAAEWEEFVVDLDAYAGQSIYISIRYYAVDAFALIIDDYQVTAETLSNEQFVIDNNFVYYGDENTLTLQSSTILNQLDVFALNGKQVKSLTLSSQENATINISDLAQGVYIAKLNTENGLHTFKFVK